MPSTEETPAAKPPRRKREGLALNLTIAALVLAVLGFGAFFGYSVYQQQQAQRAADPSYRAVQFWKEQVKASPDSASNRLRLAESFATAGMLEEAAEQLEQAIKIDPKHPGAYMSLAQIAAMQEQYAVAETHLKKVLELTEGEFEESNPRREEAYYYLGEVTLLEKKYEDAVGYFKAALRIKDTGADTYLRLAQAYVGLGENDEAIEQLKIALLFDPKYAEAHYELGKLMLEKDDNVSAALNLRVASELAPENEKVAELLEGLGTKESWLDKAEASKKSGDFETALRSCQMARALDPKLLAAAMLEAELLEKLGKPDGALLAFKDAWKLAPKDAAAKAGVLRLARSEAKRLEQSKDFKGALAAHKVLLEVVPDDAEALAGVKRLERRLKSNKN